MECECHICKTFDMAANFVINYPITSSLLLLLLDVIDASFVGGVILLNNKYFKLLSNSFEFDLAVVNLNIFKKTATHPNSICTMQ